MPGLNDTWEKYGCDQCDLYELLVLEVNVNRGPSSKSDLQGYIDDNSVKYPAIYHEEGGTDLAAETGNGTSGNPRYMIYPDKTFRKTGTIPSTINEHLHTSISQVVTTGAINTTVLLNAVHENVFTLTVTEDGLYSLLFYGANGRLLGSVHEKILSPGSHRIGLSRGEPANGYYFVAINNGRKITRQKVLVIK